MRNLVPVLLTISALSTSVQSQRRHQHEDQLGLVDSLRRDFMKLEEELWNRLLGRENEIDKNEVVPEVGLIKKFKRFDDSLASLYPHGITHNIENALETSYQWKLAEAELLSIYALYETFRRFARQQSAPGRVPAPTQAWMDLAGAILTDGQSSMPETLKRLRNLMKDEYLIREVSKEINFVQCRGTQSNRQMILALYENMAVTELKAYILEQFGYMLMKVMKKEDNNKQLLSDSTKSKEDYIANTMRLISEIQIMANKTSNELWMCDPQKQVKGETFIEITQFLQGYVQNEVDLNPEGTCSETCADYTYTKSHSCFKNLYCREQRRCNGKIINCKFVDSDMWVCPADASSGRRYQYIEYENGRILGRKQGGCTKRTVKVDSWWRWLFWHCSYCMCLCDEQGALSDRYFNLRAALSDANSNMVVTGMRFAKVNRIIHMQVQEGVLLPRGRIDQNTVHWKPVENYTITDRKIVNGQDYHTLTWEKRSIDLDDLYVNHGHVITGVRFKMIGSHLNFEIYATPYNFISGQLQPEKSIWIDNPITDVSRHRRRSKVQIYKADIPTRSLSNAKMASRTDQFIEFTHTDFDTDAAQTTVPFLDAQKVSSAEAVPLEGAGIYYKSASSSTGYIGLKIMPIDHSKLLNLGVGIESVN